MHKIAVVFALCFLAAHAYGSTPRRAVRGVLDMRGYDWERNGMVDMDGEWEFYWKQFHQSAFFAGAKPSVPTAYITVPGVWNNYVSGPYLTKGQGYATYRLKIICSANSKPLAIKVLTASTAMDLYVDGRKMGSEGLVGTSAQAMQPGFRPFSVSFLPKSDTIEVIAHISNFHYRKGGMWNVLKLGTPSQIKRLGLRKYTYSFLLVGSFLLIGLYHLWIFVFLARKNEYSPLYFGLFCILVIIRILTTDEYAINVWFDLDWNTVIHMEFLSLVALVPVLIILSAQLFPDEIPKRAVRLIVSLGVFFVLAVLVLPPLVFTYAMRPFQLFMCLTAVYGMAAYVRAWRHNRNGSSYFLFGFTVLLASVINDILFTSFVIQTGHFFYLGLFAFIFAQSITLAKRFSKTLTDLEQASGEMKVMNRELQQKNSVISENNHELIKLNAELDSFVYRVSHDLRAPIASVMGLIDITRIEDDPKQIEYYMALQEVSLKRMDELIADIIDYSKNNRLEINAQPIDFQKLVSESLDDHRYLENAGEIKKILQINQPHVFFSDGKRLNIVLNNLISNAIRYHNTDQPHPFMHISIEADQVQVSIEIRDNGQGIHCEHLDKVFNMFYRASHTAKGSGLGLYIVKETVAKLNGTITVTSELGEGTVFRVTIPNLHPAK